MPIDEQKVLFSILNETTLNDMFKEQIYNSVKKIIRIKICIGKNFN
jgi:beta-N-acetylhexosaminidase